MEKYKKDNAERVEKNALEDQKAKVKAEMAKV